MDEQHQQKRTAGASQSSLKRTDRQTLLQIVDEHPECTACKITSELNRHLSHAVSVKTVRRELHKAGVFRGASNQKAEIETDSPKFDGKNSEPYKQCEAQMLSEPQGAVHRYNTDEAGPQI